MKRLLLVALVALVGCGGPVTGPGPDQPTATGATFEATATTPLAAGAIAGRGTVFYQEVIGGHNVTGTIQDATGEGLSLTLAIAGEITDGSREVNQGRLIVRRSGTVFDSQAVNGTLVLTRQEARWFEGVFELTFTGDGGEATVRGVFRVQEGFARN